MTKLRRTYVMAEDAPAPMPWEKYESRLRKAWESLLNADCPEMEIHRFLERHPCLLPGPFGMNGDSGHLPFPDAVVSQPSLFGVGRREPDFMWLATNSMFFEPVLIEIEKPTKRWFTSKGTPSAYLTQAQNQLAQWRAWFAEPTNVAVFYESFDIPPILRQRKLNVSYVLIYGRRREYQNDHSLAKIRAEWARRDEYLMSFDRLDPNPKARHLYTVRRRTHAYKAIAFPPTYVLGPGFADRYLTVQGKGRALQASEWMSRSRKRFIRNRFVYWKKWAATKDHGPIRLEVE